MRGVVSAGMVLALEQLGLLSCFDAVYGSSAGAMNGAYFVAGQAAYGTTIYYENINNRQFIDFLRLVRGRPIVDLDFLVDNVMAREKPLDTGRVIRSPVPLIAVATDAITGERTALRDFANAADLLHALRASASMPVVAGSPYPYRDGRYCDALITESIPVPIAEADGHSHILVLLTRPYDGRPRKLSLIERFVIAKQLRRISPHLASRYLARVDIYNGVLKAISAGVGPAGTAQITAIRPLSLTVGKLERRRDHLVAGAAQGLQAVMSAIVGRCVNTVETLGAFDDTGHRLTWKMAEPQAFGAGPTLVDHEGPM